MTRLSDALRFVNASLANLAALLRSYLDSANFADRVELLKQIECLEKTIQANRVKINEDSTL
jgi:hypothetical protein